MSKCKIWVSNVATLIFVLWGCVVCEGGWGGWGCVCVCVHCHRYGLQKCHITTANNNKVVLEPRVSPENTLKYGDTVTVFAKT